MLVSSNEIDQTARKACVASGLGHDRAADLAAAAVWLLRMDHDGASALAAMLNEGGFTLPIAADTTGGVLHCNPTRPALEGIAAIDWLIAEGREGVIRLEGLVHPVMMLGLLGNAASSHRLAFSIDTENDDAIPLIVTASSGLHDAGMLPEILTLRLADAPQRTGPQQAGHLNVEERTWKRLSAMAYKTYVPSSEASRLKGAGAGLVDND